MNNTLVCCSFWRFVITQNPATASLSAVKIVSFQRQNPSPYTKFGERILQRIYKLLSQLSPLQSVPFSLLIALRR